MEGRTRKYVTKFLRLIDQVRDVLCFHRCAYNAEKSCTNQIFSIFVFITKNTQANKNLAHWRGFYFVFTKGLLLCEHKYKPVAEITLQDSSPGKSSSCHLLNALTGDSGTTSHRMWCRSVPCQKLPPVLHGLHL